MSNASSQDTIDLKAVFRKVFAKWWLFVICVGVFGALAVAYIKTTPKRYAVQGVMLMSEKKRNNFGAANDEFLKGTAYLSSNGELEDQISVLMSYANILKTVKKLDFTVTYYEEKNFLRKEAYANKPFIVKLDSGLQVTDVPIEITPNIAAGTYRVKAKGKNVHLFDPKQQRTVDEFVPQWSVDAEVRMADHFQDEHLSFFIEWPKDRTYSKAVKYTFAISSPDGLAGYYRSKTMTSPQSDESNIITITTTGEVIPKEKDFINMLMRTYIEGEQDKHNEKGNRTIAFIDSQLDRSSQDLSSAASNLQSAQASGGSLVGDATTRTSAVYNDLSRLQDEQGKLRSRLDYLSELVNRMSNEDSGSPSTISAANLDAPALTNLIDQYNKDVSDLAQKRLVEKIQSPATIAMARRVQTERTQIIQSAQDVRRATQIDLDQISNRVGQVSYQLNQLPQNTRQVENASRKYQITEGINTYLMQKRYEAEIAVASDQVDKCIVDEARAVSAAPVAPDKKVALGGAIFLGILLPLLFILIKDFFDDRINGLEELKRLSAIPVLSTIPTSKKQRVVKEDPKSVLAESFRTTRINLQYLNADVARQVVGITSSTSGEGKTFCSINLATVMALTGKRTLVIDADMRRPRVHEYLGMADGPGLSTYLIGEAGLDQVLRRTDVEGMDVITAGPVPPNPLELVESPRLAELFQQLRGRYDQIVVDASPMGLVSEFKILMRHLDITLYVVRQGYTRRGQLRHVNELHKDGKVQRIDLLLNDVKADEGYGYHYDSK
ncbi:MAG: polysaccharide biosynthesis tyrosine autokinase [Flavobacteriales bacterium]